MIKKADYFTNNDWDLIKTLAKGGAEIGTSAALITSLLNYLGHLKNTKNEDDDDTLYIKAKEPAAAGPVKAASVDEGNSFWAGPVGMTGAVLSTVGAYALIKKLYHKMRREQAQKELDKAQVAFLNAQGYDKVASTDKQAADRGLSGASMLVDSALALPLILALGTGVATNMTLNKHFPVKKKPVKEPRRIKIVTNDQLAGDEVKSASFPASDSDAAELIIRSALMAKKAGSDVRNLVGDIILAGTRGIEKAASDLGFVNALDTVKGRALEDADPVHEQIAISYLAKSASIAPQTQVLAAAEFAENYPFFYKTACSLDQHEQEALYKIACLIGKAIRTDIYNEAGLLDATEKSAGNYPFLMESDVLDEIAADKDRTPDSEGDSHESTDTSQVEAGIKKEKKTPKFVSSSRYGLRVEKDLKSIDEIDKLLNPSSANADS